MFIERVYSQIEPLLRSNKVLVIYGPRCGSVVGKFCLYRTTENARL